LELSVDTIKDLRHKTGAGVMDCKRALEEAGGNVEQAEELLREKGLADAAKRVGRETREGVVEAYIHTGGRLGALVEINCETDFVARTPDIKELAHALAMQVAAMPATRYVDKEDMSEDDESPVEEVCLLEQSYIKDPSSIVRDIVQEAVAKVGENIRVRRFARFALGE
jgi:elongation factor Ts